MTPSEIKNCLTVIRFFTVIKRPLNAGEIWEILAPEERPDRYENLKEILNCLESENKIISEKGLYIASPSNLKISETREKTNQLLSQKWRKIIACRPLFDLVPFLNFTLISGSVALGNVHENSDFDVIIGCRRGRIFIIRAFIFVLFAVLGLKRNKSKTGSAARDRFCFNHFIAPSAYGFNEQKYLYWHFLCRSLKPIYGLEKEIVSFFNANEWAGRRIVIFDKKYYPKRRNLVRLFLEILLGGPAGDLIEKFFKNIQTRQFEKTLASLNPAESRFFFNDSELELHLDVERIKKIENKIAEYGD